MENGEGKRFNTTKTKSRLDQLYLDYNEIKNKLGNWVKVKIVHDQINALTYHLYIYLFIFNGHSTVCYLSSLSTIATFKFNGLKAKVWIMNRSQHF